MRFERYQKGLSSLAWLTVLAVGGFVLMCTFRLVPVYMDDRYIQEALRSLGSSASDFDEMSNSDIRKQLNNFFMVNNIRSQSASGIKIQRKRDDILVSMEYEVRVPILYNVSAVMSFNNVWDSRRPHECCKPESE